MGHLPGYHPPTTLITIRNKVSLLHLTQHRINLNYEMYYRR